MCVRVCVCERGETGKIKSTREKKAEGTNDYVSDIKELKGRIIKGK